ncbi:MAG: hypothetical protein R3C46_14600 [Hyphomonadaceae bacterium]
MAEKSAPIDIGNPYHADDYDFGVLYGSETHKPTWTDGFPHDFHGWGPQTPDPEATGAGEAGFAPDNSLTWVGGSDAHNHHVWRFDGRRRHHH